MRVAVVGAGPSGLVTLKYLVTAHKFLGIEPIEARLFESEAHIGGTFVARVYEDAEASRHKRPTYTESKIISLTINSSSLPNNSPRSRTGDLEKMTLTS